MSDTPSVHTLTEAEQSALAAIDESETVTLLRELIRCPSENPPGGEAATVDRLSAFFTRHGVGFTIDEVEPGRPNLTAELGSADGPTLVLNGHTDTVPAGQGWTVDPFGADVRDGRVYGRGSCDMLAGVAAMSSAVAALKRSGVALAGRVLVHAVIDEEVVSKGSRLAAETVTADWVIVTEPSGGRIEAYGKGQLNVEIVFRGKAAHSSTPEVGRNAIHDAAAFVSNVERAHEQAAGSPYPGVGPATYMACVIAGGSTGSIVPADCTLTLDRRLLPTETLEDAQADVRRLVDKTAAERPGLDATVRPTLLFPPLPPGEDNVLTRTLQGVLRDVGAGDGRIAGATGATDAAWYAARGIPTVIYGPGDGGTAHQPDEFVEVEDLRLGTRALTLAAMRLLADFAP